VELISITYCVFCKVELDSVIVVFVFVLCVSVFFGLSFGQLLCKKRG
jgi:hypothetical protein